MAVESLHQGLELHYRFVGGAVEEGWEDAVSQTVAPFSHFPHRTQDFVYTVYRHGIQLGWDEHPIAGHERRDVQHIQRRGHIEDDHVISNVLEKAADDLSGEIGDHHCPFGLFCLLVAWDDIQIFPGGYDDIRDGSSSTTSRYSPGALSTPSANAT